MAEAANEATQPEGLSRRDFAQFALKAGAVAGAAVWVAPQMSSYALAQPAGSSPPENGGSRGGEGGGSNGSEGGETHSADPGGSHGSDTGGSADDPAGGSSNGTGASGAGGSSSSGTLPFTGADVRGLVVAGGAAALTGSGLVAGKRLMDRRDRRAEDDREDPGDETVR